MSNIQITDSQGKEWTFDESEAIYRKSVYGCAIREGQVLLVKDARVNKWELPGGGVDQGETVEQALVREIKEETGLEADLTNLKLLHDVLGYYKPLELSHPWKTDRSYFSLEIKNPSGEILKDGNGDDISECKWTDLADIELITINEIDLFVIKKALQL